MSLRFGAFIGAWVIGLSTGALAESNLPEHPEALAAYLHSRSIRQFLTEDQRSELPLLTEQTATLAKQLGPSCASGDFAELYLHDPASSEPVDSEPVGYEALVFCEDEPSPAVALLFDRDLRYLAAFSLAK